MLEEATEENCNSTCQGYHFCAGRYQVISHFYSFMVYVYVLYFYHQDYDDFEECVKDYYYRRLNDFWDNVEDIWDSVFDFFTSVVGIIVAVLGTIVLMVIVITVLCCCGCLSCASFSQVFNKR